MKLTPINHHLKTVNYALNTDFIFPELAGFNFCHVPGCAFFPQKTG
jgi:hypothetical protein